jgi:excisionase family DNA binding protein
MEHAMKLTRRWYSQREAAEYLGCTDRTIRNYIRRGVLPASRVRDGRTIRIDVADLDNLLCPVPTAGGAA